MHPLFLLTNESLEKDYQALVRELGFGAAVPVDETAAIANNYNDFYLPWALSKGLEVRGGGTRHVERERRVGSLYSKHTLVAPIKTIEVIACLCHVHDHLHIYFPLKGSHWYVAGLAYPRRHPLDGFLPGSRYPMVDSAD